MPDDRPIDFRPNKHLDFMRYGIALARGRGSHLAALDAALDRGWRGGNIETVLRSAVAAGTTSDTDWASKLTSHVAMVDAWQSSLALVSLPDALAAAGVNVPLNMGAISVVVSTTTTSSGAAVAQGKPKPIRRLDIASTNTDPVKIAETLVVTDELLRMAGDGGAALLDRELRVGLARGCNDACLVDLTNGVSATPATGSTVAAFKVDIAAALARMQLGADSRVFAAVPLDQMQSLAWATTPGGAPALPGLTLNGGSFGGVTFLPIETALDSSGSEIVLVDAAQVAISRGPITLDAARHASVQMDTAPDDPVAAGTILQSLWQRNLVALRCERYMIWQKLRTTAVAVISSTSYAA